MKETTVHVHGNKKIYLSGISGSLFLYREWFRGLCAIIKRNGFVPVLVNWKGARYLIRHFGCPQMGRPQYGDFLYTGGRILSDERQELINILQKQRRDTFDVLGRLGIVQDGVEEIVEKDNTIGWKAFAKIK